jgi:hypothetical protein
MSNFLQATEDDVHMYAKFGGSTSYELLKLNTPNFDLLQFSIMQYYTKLQGYAHKDSWKIHFISF